MFVPCKYYQPCVIFVGKARSLPYSWASERGFVHVGTCLACKHWTGSERLARDKHSSFLQKSTLRTKKFYIGALIGSDQELHSKPSNCETREGKRFRSWMKQNETKRNEMKWNEMKWNEMKWNEMKWNEMKWNEMKRNEMKQNETKFDETDRAVSSNFVSFRFILFCFVSFHFVHEQNLFPSRVSQLLGFECSSWSEPINAPMNSGVQYYKNFYNCNFGVVS